jgi:hypothetical protein
MAFRLFFRFHLITVTVNIPTRKMKYYMELDNECTKEFCMKFISFGCCLGSMGSSTSHNPIGLHGLLLG